MQLCDQFRALIDRSIARTPALDMPTVEARYADRFEGVQPALRYTVLYDLIRQLLKSPSGLSFAQFRDMRKALRYQSITGLPTNPYSDKLRIPYKTPATTIFRGRLARKKLG